MVKKNTAQTSPLVASKAAQLLRSPSSSAKVKTVAASDLRQTNPTASETPKWKKYLNNREKEK
jgi:hypothetical protein